MVVCPDLYGFLLYFEYDACLACIAARDDLHPLPLLKLLNNILNRLLNPLIPQLLILTSNNRNIINNLIDNPKMANHRPRDNLNFLTLLKACRDGQVAFFFVQLVYEIALRCERHQFDWTVGAFVAGDLVVAVV